jgi:hypothetical protein
VEEESEEIEDEEDEEDDNVENVQIPLEEQEQEEEERERSSEIEIIGERILQNANNEPRLHKPNEIHEFYNVGAWLRRKQ